MTIAVGKVLHRSKTGQLLIFSHADGYSLVNCDRSLRLNVLDSLEANWKTTKQQIVSMGDKERPFVVLESFPDLVAAMSGMRYFERQLADLDEAASLHSARA